MKKKSIIVLTVYCSLSKIPVLNSKSNLKILKTLKFICQFSAFEDSYNKHKLERTILSDNRNATAKNQSCFIQAVISSNYVKINQQNFFAVSCFEGLSNFVQRYHQTGENQGRNLTSRMPYFKLEFPEDMETLTDKEETR